MADVFGKAFGIDPARPSAGGGDDGHYMWATQGRVGAANPLTDLEERLAKIEARITVDTSKLQETLDNLQKQINDMGYYTTPQYFESFNLETVHTPFNFEELAAATNTLKAHPNCQCVGHIAWPPEPDPELPDLLAVEITHDWKFSPQLYESLIESRPAAMRHMHNFLKNPEGLGPWNLGCQTISEENGLSTQFVAPAYGIITSMVFYDEKGELIGDISRVKITEESLCETSSSSQVTTGRSLFISAWNTWR